MQAVPLAGAPLKVRKGWRKGASGAGSTDLENDTERSKTEVRKPEGERIKVQGRTKKDS